MSGRFKWLAGAIVCCALWTASSAVHAQDEQTRADAESTEVEATEEEAAEERDTPRTDYGYPIRWARRPLVLLEGMVRADGRIYVGGNLGPGTLSSIDIGGAVSPVDGLEIGISSQRIGTVPITAGNGLITAIMSPNGRYGDIPIYARYQFHETRIWAVGIDVVLTLPANTDFKLTANVPMRIFEILGLFTMDMNTGFTLVAGDSYAGFTTDPSNITFDFDWGGAGTVNITDHGFIQIGGGVSVVNLNGGAGVKSVLELPFFLGGGYTYESKKNLLVDFFVQSGFLPLMFANQPQGIEMFEVASTWFVTFGAQVYTEPLFGKHRRSKN
jgi:hypothetical protein